MYTIIEKLELKKQNGRNPNIEKVFATLSKCPAGGGFVVPRGEVTQETLQKRLRKSEFRGKVTTQTKDKQSYYVKRIS